MKVDMFSLIWEGVEFDIYSDSISPICLILDPSGPDYPRDWHNY